MLHNLVRIVAEELPGKEVQYRFDRNGFIYACVFEGKVIFFKIIDNQY